MNIDHLKTLLVQGLFLTIFRDVYREEQRTLKKKTKFASHNSDNCNLLDRVSGSDIRE